MTKVDPEGKVSIRYDILPIGELFIYVHNDKKHWFCGRKKDGQTACRIAGYYESYPVKEFFMHYNEKVIWIQFDQEGNVFNKKEDIIKSWTK